jgi:3-phosphoshikimate 1-carboxyvinyltransferase
MRKLLRLPLKSIELSSADDVQVLLSILEGNQHDNWDVGHAGTAFRFLLAYSVLQDRKITLTGSSRLVERPIKPLVEQLQSLGANIQFLENGKSAPLLITPSKVEGGSVKFQPADSSQFISALLLIASFIKGGLVVQFDSKQLSQSYIQMTLSVMKKYGIPFQQNGTEIQILTYDESIEITDVNWIESDWSSMSYWYLLALLLPHGQKMEFGRFERKSVQPDSIISNWFQNLGIQTKWKADGIIELQNTGEIKENVEFDSTLSPDIAQTVLVACVLEKIPCKITGLKTLPKKECNRFLLLPKELKKLGIQIQINSDFSWEYLGEKYRVPSRKVEFLTYKDHRMAMCLSPFFVLFPDLITFDDPKVVSKSYPKFWGDIQIFSNSY